MWKQYTRETSARPGVAVVAIIITFGATIGLAQWTVVHRSVETSITPAGWPFKFTLPPDFSWTESPSSDFRHAITDADEIRVFQGYSPTLKRCTLIVAYTEAVETVGPAELMSKGVQMLMGEGKSIQIGPLSGIVTKIRDRESDMSQLHAEASNGRNLRIEIYMLGDASTGRLMKAMKKLCDSVELAGAEKSPT